MALETSVLESYGYGTLAVFLISLLALLGVVLVPFLSKTYYSYLILGLIALAIGTMSGDAFLHLIPQALGLHEHSHSKVNDHSHREHLDAIPSHTSSLHADAAHDIKALANITTIKNDDKFHDNDAIWKLLVVLLTVFVFHVMELLLRYLQEIFEAYKRRKAGLPVPASGLGHHHHHHHHHGQDSGKGGARSHNLDHDEGHVHHTHLFIPIPPTIKKNKNGENHISSSKQLRIANNRRNVSSGSNPIWKRIKLFFGYSISPIITTPPNEQPPTSQDRKNSSLNSCSTSGLPVPSEIVRFCPTNTRPENEYELARHDDHVDFLVRRAATEHLQHDPMHLQQPHNNSLPNEPFFVPNDDELCKKDLANDNSVISKHSHNMEEFNGFSKHSQDSFPVLLRVCLNRSSLTCPKDHKNACAIPDKPIFRIDDCCHDTNNLSSMSNLRQDSVCCVSGNDRDSYDNENYGDGNDEPVFEERIEHRHHDLKHDHSTCHHRDIMKAQDVINTRKREINKNLVADSCPTIFPCLDTKEARIEDSKPDDKYAYDNKSLLISTCLIKPDDTQVNDSCKESQTGFPKIHLPEKQHSSSVDSSEINSQNEPSHADLSTQILIRKHDANCNGDEYPSLEIDNSTDKNATKYVKSIDEEKRTTNTKDYANEQIQIEFKSRSNGICGLQSLSIFLILGDIVHNIIDGIAIGAAFSSSVKEGISTAFAVFCHELPHELGDFAVLVSTGMSFKAALFVNLFSALTSFFGLYLALGISNNSIEVRKWIFAVTAGMFIYVSFVDMLPELREIKVGSKAWSLFCQNLGIAVGVALMLLVGLYEHLLF